MSFKFIAREKWIKEFNSLLGQLVGEAGSHYGHLMAKHFGWPVITICSCLVTKTAYLITATAMAKWEPSRHNGWLQHHPLLWQSSPHIAIG